MKAADYHQRVLRALMFIEQNLDDDLSLERLAAVACFSPFHFHHLFRGMIGEPVAQYVRRIRLERAAGQLHGSARPVTEIAFDAGYDSHEAFTRAFRARFGLSPSAFRASNRPEPSSAVPADVRIVRFPSRRAAIVRHIGPYNEAGGAWARLYSWAGRHGRLGPGMIVFGISHDDPELTDPAKVRYDAALVVDSSFAGDNEVAIIDMPERDYATLVHVGPYSLLGESYDALIGRWLPLSERDPAPAPPIEFYRNDPRNTPPEQLITEICVPLG